MTEPRTTPKRWNFEQVTNKCFGISENIKVPLADNEALVRKMVNEYFYANEPYINHLEAENKKLKFKYKKRPKLSECGHITIQHDMWNAYVNNLESRIEELEADIAINEERWDEELGPIYETMDYETLADCCVRMKNQVDYNHYIYDFQREKIDKLRKAVESFIAINTSIPPSGWAHLDILTNALKETDTHPNSNNS
jgi:hypothetical protein